jgi:prepilin-type N-terminal cleavage/methylation domain-containing protein
MHGLRRHHLALACGLCVSGFLLFAATGKCLDLDGFAASLGEWGIPESLRGVLSGTIAGIELLLACAWMAIPERRQVLMLLILAMIGAYTGMYAYRLSVGTPPDCECLGAWAKYLRLRNEAWETVLRNGLLIGAGAVSWWFATPDRVDNQQVPQTASCRPLRARGWTLVEVIVSITIVAILMSLVLGLVARTRAAGRQARSLSNLRQHVTIFTQYTMDWRESWPVFIRPGPWRINHQMPYFLAADLWPHYLTISGYYNHLGLDAFYSPDAPLNDVMGWDRGMRVQLLSGRNGTALSHYGYCCTFLADPAFWNVHTRTGPEQWRATKVPEVVFPSHKTLLYCLYPWLWRNIPQSPLANDLRIDWGMVDGSAIRIHERDTIPNQVSGDGPQWYYLGAVHSSPLPPGSHTLDGLRGRDVARR